MVCPLSRQFATESKMQVINLTEAASRAGFTRRTLERLIADGEGPALIKLSARRVGVLESDLTDWIMARRRPAPGAMQTAPATAQKRGPGRPRKGIMLTSPAGEAQ